MGWMGNTTTYALIVDEECKALRTSRLVVQKDRQNSLLMFYEQETGPHFLASSSWLIK